MDEANGGKHRGLFDVIAYSMALAEFSQAKSQMRGVMQAGQTSYEVIRVAWGNRTSKAFKKSKFTGRKGDLGSLYFISISAGGGEGAGPVLDRSL